MTLHLHRIDALKRHHPQEGLQELKKIAVRFEEKTYTNATNQSDYLRKISLKMLTMEAKSQTPMAISHQSNAPSNSKNPQPPAPAMDASDWRTQLPDDSRQRIINKIIDALKRHHPQEGLQELKKIAVRFEGKTYTKATSQSDYLRKISLKMLTMETKSQTPMAISHQSNAPSNSKNPQPPGMAFDGDKLRKAAAERTRNAAQKRKDDRVVRRPYQKRPRRDQSGVGETSRRNEDVPPQRPSGRDARCQPPLEEPAPEVENGDRITDSHGHFSSIQCSK